MARAGLPRVVGRRPGRSPRAYRLLRAEVVVVSGCTVHDGRVLSQAVHRYFPRLASAVRSVRVRRIARRFERDSGLERIRKAIVARHGARILGGPFEGMIYVEEAVGSCLLPKLVGSYEQETASVLEEGIACSPDLVIDVGAAEGYYAVGLARRLPGATVYAFDIDPHATRLCRRLAELNGVGGRVVTEGACTVEALQARLMPGALVICDCEGFEDELLDPNRVPGLERAQVLVELHDHLRPGISLRIKERFAKTHQVSMIPSVPRDASSARQLELLSPEDRALAVNEFRPAPQQWAWLVPV
jgi:hypothetical protein